ncbi:Fe-only nitrogenase accessory protein AnfO [Rhodocyclus tenuis]|uniref:Fe-only nitrogenase accessory protein AnfO n=1 Tax=Rhodocyclus tenuis TaxID=1066 RepID=UPI001905DC92|nr:Fe-only nitrogenase accessory protein AnfO [Rhodocyclus tenuis]MBK1680715.1 Fe-only nitrogenase accessory protein AnfO [Rhodocyclus tenuis]
MKIAAYLNPQGDVASLYEPGCFRLYQASAADEGWLSAQEIPFVTDYARPLPEIKAALHAAIAGLDDCKTLVSAEVRGVLYSVLQEELGFRIWKSEGPLLQQLDSVRQKEAEHEAQKRFEIVAFAGKMLPTPMLVGDPRDGCFWIDLKEALNHESGQTSRQILIPFLERGQFRRLEVLCDHLPKWMTWEMERLDMSAESEEIDATGSGLRVTVYPRNTPEGGARKVGLLGAGPALLLPCPRERQNSGGRVIDA